MAEPTREQREAAIDHVYPNGTPTGPRDAWIERGILDSSHWSRAQFTHLHDAANFLAAREAEAYERGLKDGPRWISVGERMPEAHHRVTVFAHGCAVEAKFNGQYWVRPGYDARGNEIAMTQAEVSAWQPMPAPPLEGEQEGELGR